MGEEARPDEQSQIKLLTALHDLRQQVYTTYSAGALPPLDEVASSASSLPERWWEVREHTFVSTVPLMGPLIAGFRRLWNSISTQWAIRAVLQQQNRVNQALAEHLDLLVNRLETQNQIWGLQGQILSELDHDQTRLITELAEIGYRLDQLESRLIALEQKK